MTQAKVALDEPVHPRIQEKRNKKARVLEKIDRSIMKQSIETRDILIGFFTETKG